MFLITNEYKEKFFSIEIIDSKYKIVMFIIFIAECKLTAVTALVTSPKPKFETVFLFSNDKKYHRNIEEFPYNS